MTVSLFRVMATWRGDSPVRGSEEGGRNETGRKEREEGEMDEEKR